MAGARRSLAAARTENIGWPVLELSFHDVI